MKNEIKKPKLSTNSRTLQARPSPNFVRENSPYGKKKSHLWGKKFQALEKKYQALELMSL